MTASCHRFFANKLWNAGRFLLGNLKDLSSDEREALAVSGPLTAEEVIMDESNAGSYIGACCVLVTVLVGRVGPLVFDRAPLLSWPALGRARFWPAVAFVAVLRAHRLSNVDMFFSPF